MEVVPLNPSVVSSVLNEGVMVGVRVGIESNWHGNIIYSVSGCTIRIAYIDKFMRGLAEPGSSVWVKYSNDYFIYYFNGTVKSVHPDTPESISVKLDSAEEMINNRLFPRYDVRLHASLKPIWDDEEYNCVVTDLSYGGAAFVCEHKFDSNEHIEMALHLPSGIITKVTGKVIRRRTTKSNAVDHAAQFIECDNMSNRQLSEYFSQLEDEVSEIYQHYVADVRDK